MFPLSGWGKCRQRQEIQNTHLVSEMEWMLQDDHMFACVHSAQEEDWWPVNKAITTHTSFFSTQQEYNSIVSPNDQIIVTTCARFTDTDEGGIRN